MGHRSVHGKGQIFGKTGRRNLTLRENVAMQKTAELIVIGMVIRVGSRNRVFSFRENMRNNSQNVKSHVFRILRNTKILFLNECTVLETKTTKKSVITQIKNHAQKLLGSCSES